MIGVALEVPNGWSVAVRLPINIGFRAPMRQRINGSPQHPALPFRAREKEFFSLAAFEWSRKVVTLAIIASQFLQLREVLAGFHSFGNGLASEICCKMHDGTHDAAVLAVAFGLR